MNCVKVDIGNKRTIFTKEEIPKAETETDVIVKVAYSGFCGTDLHIIKVGYSTFAVLCRRIKNIIFCVY